MLHFCIYHSTPPRLRGSSLTHPMSMLTSMILHPISLLTSMIFLPSRLSLYGLISISQAANILAAMESHHMANLAWVVAGNYNDPPESSVLVQVLQAAHLAVVVGSGQGTRWQQKTPREIGCAASQADICAPAVCETVHLSDHTTTCQPRRPPLQRGRFKPQPRWEKPSFVSAEDWKALVRKAWFLCCQNSDLQCLQNLGNQPIDVEQEWKRYMSLLSAVMRLATQNAAKTYNHSRSRTGVVAKAAPAWCQNW